MTNDTLLLNVTHTMYTHNTKIKIPQGSCMSLLDRQTRSLVLGRVPKRITPLDEDPRHSEVFRRLRILQTKF